MFNTVAAGMVADELPKDMIPRFLEAIQEQAQHVFSGMGEAPKVPGLENESADQVMTAAENENGTSASLGEAVSLDKKRTIVEESPKPHLESIKESFPKKKSLPVKEPPKGNSSINSFFKPIPSKK